MLSPDRSPLSFATLLAIEIRTVRLAIAREAALAFAALAGVCILSTVTALRTRDNIDAFPEVLLAAMPVALLLPWLVWKGDPVFGPAPLWTLPVRRQRAASAKLAAGGLWLILAMLAALAALLLTALATGGSFGHEEMRLVGPDLATASQVHWSTPAWRWCVPFGAALIAYVAASAVLLGLRHPLRWLAGAATAVVLLAVLSVNLEPHSALNQALGRTLETAVAGRWGLDFALTAGVTTLVRDVDTPGPGSVDLWKALPDAGRWAASLLLWLAAALLALALALRRHWER